MKKRNQNHQYQQQLTWTKTGWFYLWLVIFIVIWLVSKNNQFAPIEQFNLSSVSQTSLSDTNMGSSLFGTVTNGEVTSAEIAFLRKPALDKNTALHFRDTNYLIESSIVLFAEILFCLLAVWLISVVSKKSISFKAIAVVMFILLTFITQVLFLRFSIWFSMAFVNLMLIISLSILYLYQKELTLFSNQNTKINYLLENSVIQLYQELSFEPIIPMIEQCVSPSANLIDKIQEVAILAEDDKNNQLAKRLHSWIISHQSNNSISLERLTAFNLSEQEDALEDELENTLVIDGSQENTATQAELLNIKNFGRYETEGILGKGAMGIVFQGVDPKINRHVAIKTLYIHDSFMRGELSSSSEQIEQKKAVERFFREAETAGNLSHANIVTIYDVGEQEVESPTGLQTLGYIAMDLLEGSALDSFTTQKNLLPPYLVFQLMIQMADALEYAHQSNVVHRDIKPANIIFNQTLNKATLTDFGIAYIIDHNKTKTGTIMGSPYYMSPEQVIGKKVDGRSDIFSLGVTMYQLLTGELPFRGESIASVAFHITNTKHQSVRNHLSKLPSSTARITNKALQKDVGKRYQSMKEFKQALVNALKKDYKKQPL